MILTADGIDVVAEAATGAEAIDAVRRTRPDVVLMDIRMPVLDGLEATRRILADGADGADGPRILMLTTFDVDEYVYAALAAGASGFLLKDVAPEQLTAAVRLVRSGDALLAPTITRRLVERFARGGQETSAVHRDLASLTPREREVLQLLARGPEQRRARRGVPPVRGDGQDARGADPGQAAAARPGPGGRRRLRDGSGRARGVLSTRPRHVRPVSRSRPGGGRRTGRHLPRPGRRGRRPR